MTRESVATTILSDDDDAEMIDPSAIQDLNSVTIRGPVLTDYLHLFLARRGISNISVHNHPKIPDHFTVVCNDDPEDISTRNRDRLHAALSGIFDGNPKVSLE